MGVRQMSTGFQIGEYGGVDWTRRMTISRELAQDGSEFCVCWVGSFWLVTDRSGGVSGEGEGVALGLTASGEAWSDVAWEAQLAGFEQLPEGNHPLATAVSIAPAVAEFATLLLPVVDAGFAMGADFEWALEVARSDPQFQSLKGAAMCLALTLLWRAEEERREQSAGD